MTGADLSIQIDDTQARRAFAALQRLMADTTPVMSAIGVGLARDTRDHFMDGSDPWGTPWHPLLPAYKSIKRGSGILKGAAMAGGLMGSITRRATATSVEVGTNKIYGAAHQFGATIYPKRALFLRFELAHGMVLAKKVTIPSRPYLGIGPAEERTIVETTVDALDRQLAKAGAKGN